MALVIGILTIKSAKYMQINTGVRSGHFINSFSFSQLWS